MSDATLNALLALRKAIVQLGIDANAAQKAQLDIMATVLARLIVERRDWPALRANWQEAMGNHSLPATSGAAIKHIADAAVRLAVDSDSACAMEIAQGAAIAALGNPQNEAFARERFRDYLIDKLGENPAIDIADVRLASRGFSKKTILVELRNARSLPANIALRVDRPFNFLGTTVRDEYAPLAALHRAGVRLPKPHALEAGGAVLDGPFIIFDRMPGALVGNNFQAPGRNPVLAADVAACLAQLHRTPLVTVGNIRGADRSSREQVRQEIDKSYGHWQALQRDIPLMETAFQWLYANLDLAGSQQAVVHGDYNFNNILVDADRVAAVVDWEFVQVGDPAMDLGWFYLGAEGICGWQEFLRLYETAGGFHFGARQLDYFKLLGQTRLAVMTLQTESGFDEGRFDDIKFGLSGALYTNKSLQRVGSLLAAVC
jgi:aminoglycoside phosphotransferase (APT) family kinase protein